jgi:hypothetical protein
MIILSPYLIKHIAWWASCVLHLVVFLLIFFNFIKYSPFDGFNLPAHREDQKEGIVEFLEEHPQAPAPPRSAISPQASAPSEQAPVINNSSPESQPSKEEVVEGDKPLPYPEGGMSLPHKETQEVVQPANTLKKRSGKDAWYKKKPSTQVQENQQGHEQHSPLNQDKDAAFKRYMRAQNGHKLGGGNKSYDPTLDVFAQQVFRALASATTYYSKVILVHAPVNLKIKTHIKIDKAGKIISLDLSPSSKNRDIDNAIKEVCHQARLPKIPSKLQLENFDMIVYFIIRQQPGMHELKFMPTYDI